MNLYGVAYRNEYPHIFREVWIQSLALKGLPSLFQRSETIGHKQNHKCRERVYGSMDPL